MRPKKALQSKYLFVSQEKLPTTNNTNNSSPMHIDQKEQPLQVTKKSNALCSKDDKYAADADNQSVWFVCQSVLQGLSAKASTVLVSH